MRREGAALWAIENFNFLNLHEGPLLQASDSSSGANTKATGRKDEPACWNRQSLRFSNINSGKVHRSGASGVPGDGSGSCLSK